MAEEFKQKSFLVHKGKFAQVLPMYPKVESFTLAHGWSQDMKSRFPCAVQRVIDINPILSGRVTKTSTGKIVVQTGMSAFKNQEHSRVVDISTIVTRSPVGLLQNEMFEYIHEHVYPHLKSAPTLVRDEIKGKLSLFDATLFLLPDDHVCYHVGMSHSIGDAETYYMILDQVSAVLNQEKEVHEVKWENPSTAVHEPLRKGSALFPFAFACGVFANGLSSAFKSNRVANLVLSREAIERKKTELVAPSNQYLSSHDIVLAALCRLNASSEILSFYMDVRSRQQEHFDKRDGGNCLSQVTFPTEAGRDPNMLRKIVDEQAYFKEGQQPPLSKYARGRFGFTTSWANSTKLIAGKGIANICHVPCKHFLGNLILDVAVIYQMNEECLGVAYFFNKSTLEEDRLDLLNQITWRV